VWPHEAYDFTQWLQENIEHLNDVLDVNLSVVDREKAAGPFSIDLVAEDENGAAVVIENQLEKSNHDHLGKLITYLTAMDAKAAIWIVADPRPEHVAAITWLNEAGAAGFYMVKVEAVQIGESNAAPLFTLIVGPSDEALEIGQQKKQLASRFFERREWWTALLERAKKVTSLHAHISPAQAHWISTSAGTRGLGWNYVVWQTESAAELYIDRGQDLGAENKRLYEELLSHRDDVESAFGDELEWQRLEGKRACRIRFKVEGGGYRSPQEDWPTIQDKTIDAMVRLEKALGPYVSQLNF